MSGTTIAIATFAGFIVGLALGSSQLQRMRADLSGARWLAEHEAPNPDDLVRITQVPELPHDPHARGFLDFNKLPFKQTEEHIPLARTQSVSP
jgi:hypothetical protein